MDRPPLRVRKEPVTRKEILEEIAFLEEKLNGDLDEAIEDRIKILKARLTHNVQ
jgi:hypothetical protein